MKCATQITKYVSLDDSVSRWVTFIWGDAAVRNFQQNIASSNSITHREKPFIHSHEATVKIQTEHWNVFNACVRASVQISSAPISRRVCRV